MSVANRSYYSYFYVVSSLFLKNEIEAQTRDDAISQFGLHLEKNGMINMEYRNFFSKLFDFKQKGVYGVI